MDVTKSENNLSNAIFTTQDQKALEEALASSDVVFFCKGDYVGAYEAQQVLRCHKIQYNLIDLEKDANGPKLTNALQAVVGGSAMPPYCFVRGVFVGEANRLIEIVSMGLIEERMQGIDDLGLEFDVIIIGGGSAGLSAAKEASKYGKKVALADLSRPTVRGHVAGLGGRVTNSGDLPRKFLHRAGLLREDYLDAPFYGWEKQPSDSKETPHNWNLMIAGIRSYVETISWQRRKELREAGITFYEGWASFKDTHSVEVVDRDGHKLTLTAKSFVIAVGSKTKSLNIPGEEFISTPEDIFATEGRPDKVLILGSGYDGIELASAFSGLGYDVSIALTHTSPNMDKDVEEKIFEIMRLRGVIFLADGLKVTQASVGDESGSEIKIEALRADEGDSKFSDTYNMVINAINRRPNTDHLGLNTVSRLVLNSDNCKIIVNEWDQTSVPNIFAVGSVADHAEFHSSSTSARAGEMLMKRMLGGSLDKLNYEMAALRVLSPIEYAFVGHSEESARRVCESAIEVFHRAFSTVDGALSNRVDSNGYIKVICRKDPCFKVLGIHILCLHASQVLQGFVLEFQSGRLTKLLLDELITIKPSAAENFNKLSAVEDSGGEVKSGTH